MVVSVIKSNGISHLRGYGFCDIENSISVTDSTSFHIASVSKIVTSIAIFRLIQKRKIELDVNINDYLPFEVKSPYYPNSIITVGELLNHKSGIRDNINIYKAYWNNPQGDPRISLKEFLYSYLHPEGDLYKKSHFEKNEDYKSFKYSNTGYALLGLIVEQVSGEKFSEFCSRNIFTPLEMNSTGWFLSDLDVNNVAKTYAKNKDGEPVFLGHNGYPDYPAGQLRTSIADFTKVLQGLLKPDQDFMLSSKSVLQMLPEMEDNDKRFTWFTTNLDGNKYYYHGGGDIGVRTMVIINRKKGDAAVVFANAVFNEVEFIKSLNSIAFSLE